MDTRTGFQGAFVISGSQTEVNGQRFTSPDNLTEGALWCWSGQAVRVDGRADMLLLDGAIGMAELHKRAARSVRRLVGRALSQKNGARYIWAGNHLVDSTIVLSNGKQTYAATVIESGSGGVPLLMFLNEVPPKDISLRIESCSVEKTVAQPVEPFAGGVICFTLDTRIRTPDGDKQVKDLREGDKLLTKDDGPQEIIWIGQRRISGARLHAMPQLRPIRINAGALCEGEPDEGLLVSPEHRLLVKGPASRALFNTTEVLVAAKDLLNDRTVLVDHTVREVTYVHMMLERHQVVWANGVETESFHPANTPLEAVEGEQRTRLFNLFPDLAQDPFSYGGYARRNLTTSDAEILKHDSVLHH